MTQHSERLGTGVGPLRWTDSPESLLAKYPDARAIPVRHARHPITGAALVLLGGYRVTGVLLSDDRWRVLFDGSRLASLEWMAEAGDNDWRAAEHAYDQMVHRLAERYGFGPVDDPHQDTTWTVDGVRVHYSVEGDAYLVRIAPMATVELAASA